MERVKLQVNLQESERKSETTKCTVCGKQFPKEESRKIFSTKRKNFTTVCSEECEKTIKHENAKKAIETTLPKKYWSLESDNKKIVVTGMDESLFLSGNSGAGKTVAMATIYKEHIRAGRKAKWIDFTEFIMQLQSTFRKEDEDAYQFMKSIAGFEGLLCIDDLGAEKMTDFVRQSIYFLINHREQNELQTVITSNFSLEQIDTQIDSRVSSRIAGMCRVWYFNGKDRRLK